ncbi:MULTISPECIES: hypothetical protein [unclassified Lactobacillus]|uniref:hypothetical protein n=1 Tax=unclassified Lactobacillus TaxID=2620435 RepID=UPI0013146195|nr:MULTISPECIES: hypothetical protein [unclassified Lactobacillus]
MILDFFLDNFIKLKKEYDEQERQATQNMARMQREFEEMHKRNEKQRAKISSNIDKYL